MEPEEEQRELEVEMEPEEEQRELEVEMEPEEEQRELEVEMEPEQQSQGKNAFLSWKFKQNFTLKKEKRERNITVQCNLCLPATNLLSASSKDSTSNLKKHLKVRAFTLRSVYPSQERCVYSSAEIVSAPSLFLLCRKR
ncbi:unnamed protein product [Leuciscus chuanchicus]